jgi:dTDP-4-dehydrorhamnose reductase
MTLSSKTKVLVLGVSGMLGNVVLRAFAQSNFRSVFGAARLTGVLRLLPPELREQVICGVDVENADSLMQLFAQVRPDVVINCIGIVKQLTKANDPLASITISTISFPQPERLW